jgi:hypothetical protein
MDENLNDGDAQADIIMQADISWQCDVCMRGRTRFTAAYNLLKRNSRAT